MGLVLLTERHAQQISGVLSCYDRVMVQGTLPVFCYAEGMTAYLSKRRIRIFDFTQFAKPLTDAIKANAEQVATANGLTIDYVRKKNFRKEDKVKAVLKQRDHSLDWCGSSRPWSHALPTSRGMTKTAGGPIFGTTTASVCTTISTSWMKIWDSATCECPPGALSGCSSTATATTGWRGSWIGTRSATRLWTTPSHPSRIGRPLRAWRTAGTRRFCTANWTRFPPAIAPF